MANWKLAKDHPIEGEVWRTAPNGLCTVSDQGRCQNVHGHLLTAFNQGAGPLRWRVLEGKRIRLFDPAILVAETFLGGCPREPVTFINGDRMDWRAANLRIPWTAEQDAVIEASISQRAAAAELGLSRSRVRRRAATLGKVWPRTQTPTAPLVERVSLVQDAVEVLEAAGIPDGWINKALSITPGPRRGKHFEPRAQKACLSALLDASWSKERIASALGMQSGSNITATLRRHGLVADTGWKGGTKAGAPESLDGEEWRRHPWGYWVSSLGRVAGQRGLLQVTRHPAWAPRVHLWSPGRKTSVHLWKLMLEVFRPGQTFHRRLILNGDLNDVRLANLGSEVDATAAAAQIRRLIPAQWDLQDRREAEQFAVLAMLEGRAATPSEAVRIAKAEHRKLIGAYTHQSLDQVGEDGRIALDSLVAG